MRTRIPGRLKGTKEEEAAASSLSIARARSKRVARANSHGLSFPEQLFSLLKEVLGQVEYEVPHVRLPPLRTLWRTLSQRDVRREFELVFGLFTEEEVKSASSRSARKTQTKERGRGRSQLACLSEGGEGVG